MSWPAAKKYLVVENAELHTFNPEILFVSGHANTLAAAMQRAARQAASPSGTALYVYELVGTVIVEDRIVVEEEDA